MLGRDLSGHLQLQDYAIETDEIGNVGLAKAPTLVFDVDLRLRPENAAIAEFQRQSLVVHSFQKSGTERAVHLEHRAAYQVGLLAVEQRSVQSV